ncbi:MAG: TolC family protein [Planctomycetaceae bacterium]|nr:TolC family protein [Planctomycetaceae bacterium]
MICRPASQRRLSLIVYTTIAVCAAPAVVVLWSTLVKRPPSRPEAQSLPAAQTWRSAQIATDLPQRTGARQRQSAAPAVLQFPRAELSAAPLPRQEALQLTAATEQPELDIFRLPDFPSEAPSTAAAFPPPVVVPYQEPAKPTHAEPLPRIAASVSGGSTTAPENTASAVPTAELPPPARVAPLASTSTTKPLTFPAAAGAATTSVPFTPSMPDAAPDVATSVGPSTTDLAAPQLAVAPPSPAEAGPQVAFPPVAPPAALASEPIATPSPQPPEAPSPFTPSDIAPSPPAFAAQPSPQLAASPADLPPSIPDPWAALGGHAAPPPADAATITIDQARYLALVNNKDIAVLGHMPQIAATAIGTEAAVFDPVFNVNTQGGHYDRQTSTQIQSLGTTIPVLKTTFFLPGAGLNLAYLEKQFRSGARVQAGVGQNLYSYSPAGSFVFVNPAWTSSLNLLLEQPLFRGRGAVATEAPLKIARANQQQSWQSFQATVNQILRDAEFAYWQTYSAYRELHLRDLALAQALRTVEREQERFRLGEAAIPDVAEAIEQAEEFRIERADAENRFIAAARELRRVMGVPPDDPRPIVPATPAGDAPLVVDYASGNMQALGRPEIAAQRAVVEAANIEVCRRRNGLQPDLAVRAIYSVSGLDSQLDGAWNSVGSWNYNDWTAGVVYKQPLGRRADQSAMQRAQAALAMETARLNQIEHEVLHQLAGAADEVQAAERMMNLHRRRREAAAVQLEARRELFIENKATLREQLDAEESYTSAVIDETLAQVQYQRALTAWNYARGAMNQNELVLAE